PMDADDIRAFDAEEVIIATGSIPARNGFQRALSEVACMPGVERANVHAVEEIMRREARPGRRILLLDDVGNWRGLGTAWHLAEKQHEVTIVTPDPFLGRELVRTSADIPLRARLANLGVQVFVETVVTTWHGDGASIRSLLDGREHRLPFDT